VADRRGWRGIDSFGVAVAVILLAALVLRVAAVFLTHPVICCDAPDYIRHAQSIAAGHGYPPSRAPGGPTALRPPLYPLFVAAVFVFRPNALRTVGLVQAALGTGLVALTGILAWQVFRRRDIAIVALVLAATYPPLVLWVTPILSEGLFLPIELACLVAAWQFRRDAGRLRFAILAGVLAGLGALSRQTGLLLLLPAGSAVIFASTLPGRRRLLAILAMGVATMVCVAPWVIRDALVLHAFIPVSLQNGLQFEGTYNDTSAHFKEAPALWTSPILLPEDRALFSRPGTTEVDLDRELTRRAYAYIKAHPAYVLEVVYQNTLRMLQLESSDFARVYGAYNMNLEPGPYQLHRIGFFIAALLAIAGFFTRATRQVPWWFWVSALPFFLLAAVAAGLVRYRAPLDPFLLLAGAPAVVAVWDRLRGPHPDAALAGAPAAG
jgi:4-amino-4-deoxy-L-arabinose transferase-like glycosyltransferase